MENSKKEKAPFKERAKDATIKGISVVCGIGHFAGRLLADGFRELEAQSIHAIDKGCDVSVIRKERDRSYAQRMRDLSDRIAETKKVAEQTYQEMTEVESPEAVTIAQILESK